MPGSINLSGVSSAVFLMSLRGITLLVKFGLTLYLAKYLGLETLGIYGLLAAAHIVLPSLASLGLNQSLARHAITEDPSAIVRRVNSYLGLVTVFYLSGFLIAFNLGNFEFSDSFLIASAALLFLENINSDAYTLLTNRMKPVLANVLHFIRSALWALMFMLAGFWLPESRSLMWMLIFWIAGSFASLLLLAWNLRTWPFEPASFPRKSSLIELKHEIGKSWYLYINGIATSFGTQIDRFVVSAMLGLELTGIYVFFLQIGSALSNLHYTGIIHVQRPRVLMSSKLGPEAFNRKLNSVLTVSVVSTVLTGIVAYFVVEAIIPMLGKPALSGWTALLFMVLIGVVFNVSVHAQRLYFYSLHKDDVAFYINLVTSVISVVVLVILVQWFSLIGAGIALVAGGATRLLAQHLSIGFINRRLNPVAG